jgi:formate hydrogenlyase subunit 3/multisubunit Na+/H+ antiporter MnhD subunit
LAVSGVPPFGTFISELIILYAALAGHHYVVAFFYSLFLALIFIGIADIILKMIQGNPDPSVILSAAKDLNASKDSSPSGLRMTNNKESPSMIIPILILIGIVFMLGFYIPPFLNNILQKGTGLLGG